MKLTGIRFFIFLFAGFLLFTSGGIVHAQIQYHDSSLGRYQIYATPWYNSYGNKIGVKVHYSIGALQDTGQPSHYAAVCLNSGSTYAPCVEQSAKVWTKTTSYYSVGYWVTQNVPVSCDYTVRVIQVHQPYVYSGSTLNFHVYGGSPYQGSQLFYSGTSDTAKLQIQGCNQIYY